MNAEAIESRSILSPSPRSCLVPLGVRVLALVALAWVCPVQAEFCNDDPDARARAEAALLHSAASPFATSADADEDYDALVIHCNRKRDGKGDRIEDEIPANHSFPPDLEPRIVKGSYRYFGLAPGIKYTYDLSRDSGIWVITLPIEFDLPSRRRDAIDLPIALADDLGLSAAGGICDGPAASSVFIPTLNASPADLLVSGPIDDNDANNNADSCRVPRTLVAQSATTGLQTTVIHHLREFWRQEITARWNTPGVFRIDPMFVNCEPVLGNLHNACDNPTSAQMAAWERSNIIWNVRFNLKPNHRPSFRRWTFKWDFMYTGTDFHLPHELGHVLGLDDEYGEFADGIGTGNRECTNIHVDADEYIMCDSAGDVQAVHYWLITRRYASAKEYACDGTGDCDEGEFCARRGPSRNVCETRRDEGSRCGRAEQCDHGLECRGRPFGRCVAPSNRGLGEECIRNAQCASVSCSNQGACQCVDDNECGTGSYCRKGPLGIGVNRCEALRNDGRGCTRASQCASGRCSAGFCRAQNECSGDGDCLADQFCHRAGVNDCRARHANGHTCTRAAQCDSGRCSAGFCRAQHECSDDGDCDANEFCHTAGRNDCRARHPNGHVCSRAAQCESGRCSAGFCAAANECSRDTDCLLDEFCHTRGRNDCRSRFDLGHSCTRDAQCDSNCCKVHAFRPQCRPTNRCD